MVNEGRNVKEIFFTEETGILAGPIDGKTFVDCSTIDPPTSIEIGKAVVEASPTAHFYDVPVSGGVSGAEKAILSFLAGTSEDDTYFKDRVQPILQMMGKNIFCVGGPGQGLVAKLCNNYLSGICAIATSEAMNIGIRHGIDPKLLSNIFDKSTGGNWQNGKFSMRTQYHSIIALNDCGSEHERKPASRYNVQYSLRVHTACTWSVS